MFVYYRAYEKSILSLLLSLLESILVMTIVYVVHVFEPWPIIKCSNY